MLLSRGTLRLLPTLFLGTAAGFVAGCGSSTVGNSVAPLSTTGSTGSMPTAPVPVTAGFSSGSTLTGTKDSVVATSSVSAVAVVIGASQTVSITFASSDGRLITGFGVTDTLGTLPTGWSGPSTFSCASVSTGSNCVLNLSYAPTVAGSGTLTINYEFIDDALQPKTGNSLTVTYTATASDNIVAAASPTGQIDAAVGGSQAVAVNFVTDDGNAATNFNVTTDLTQLPAGWSAAAANFACAIVGTGNGCELALAYAPTAAGSGTLTLSYSYQDDFGTAKTGSLNIPYYAASANTVVANISPASQVIAVQKTGGQPVAVTFTTNDGKPASGLSVTSNLQSLPPGWSSASGSLSCGTVSTGNGCQLHLTYAPTGLASGTLTLDYAYTDGSGMPQTGVQNVSYAATTNDNVVGTPSPSGQINAVVSDGTQPGTGTQTVAITFTTDDGRPATALQLTSSLAALPAGWSSTATSLSCSGLDADNVCKLTLAYAPSVAGSGTLMLNYTYENNANEPKTGTVSIPYRATTNDNVVGTPSQSSLPTVRTGSSASATITFTTDDGNPASTLAITSGLNPLPPGWSAATTFTCATVNAGTACTLPLTYAPTAAATAAALTLGYSYLNDAGYPGTGTVSITYSAYTPYLYVADAAAGLSACALSIDDGVASCSTVGTGFDSPSGIALYGSFAYVTNTQGNSVSRCTLDTAGALANCATVGGAFNAPTAIAVSPVAPFAYIQQSTGLTVCAIAPSDGSLTACVAAGTAYEPLSGLALAADGSHAYSVHAVVNTLIPADSIDVIDVCNVSNTGTLGTCVASTASTPLAAGALAIQNNDLYVTTTAGSLYLCPIAADSTISSCQTTATNTNAAGISFKDNTAFVSTGSTTILTCPVNVGGTLGTCTPVTDPTFNGTAGMAVR